MSRPDDFIYILYLDLLLARNDNREITVRGVEYKCFIECLSFSSLSLSLKCPGEFEVAPSLPFPPGSLWPGMVVLVMVKLIYLR